MGDDSRSARLSRRQAIGLLGAGLGFLSSGKFGAALSAHRAKRRLAPGQVTFPKGAIIRTILSDLPPEALANGTTLFHEHLDGVYSRDTRQLKLPPPSSADITPVVADVKEAMKNGVVCIVDGGHPDMGVNYDHLRQISKATGLHVVASGGYYLQNTYPAEISTMTEDQIADSLVKEAAAGRYGAYGEIGDMPDEADFTPDERKVFRAVGKAHLKNSLPIFTHNNYGTGPNVPREIALRQLDVYESVGVNPRRIAIGHMDSLRRQEAGHHQCAGQARGVRWASIASGGTPRQTTTVSVDPRVPRGWLCGSPSPRQRHAQGLQQGRAIRKTAPGGRRERGDVAHDSGRQPAPVPRLRTEERVSRPERKT